MIARKKLAADEEALDHVRIGLLAKTTNDSDKPVGTGIRDAIGCLASSGQLIKQSLLEFIPGKSDEAVLEEVPRISLRVDRSLVDPDSVESPRLGAALEFSPRSRIKDQKKMLSRT